MLRRLVHEVETVVAAAVSGLLALAGVVVTVRSARRHTTAQHVEQTGHLVAILQHQNEISGRVVELNDRVDRLNVSHDVLFNLVAEVDAKVTKPAKRKQTSTIEGNANV